MRLHEIISGLPLLLALWQRDRTEAKRVARHMAILFCRGLLRLRGRRHTLGDGVTMVFAPHQDDETLGCGGLIARKRHEGLTVHVVFITDGRSSHPGHPRFTPADMTLLRHGEALKALAVLGVDSSTIHFLDEHDGELDHLDPQRRMALVEKLAALINGIKPDEIFLSCQQDGSDEHSAAFASVSDAILRSRHQPVVWQYPIWAWWKPLFLLENLLFADWIQRLPLEDFQILKARALACYQTQIRPTPPWSDCVIPPELQTIHEFAEEYFFRFDPPAPAEREYATPPVI
jgi:N-acetylglucosamine malate deacetylase 1